MSIKTFMVVVVDTTDEDPVEAADIAEALRDHAIEYVTIHRITDDDAG